MSKHNERPIQERASDMPLFEATLDRYAVSAPTGYGLEQPFYSIFDAVIEDLYDDHYLGKVRSERR